ncbi:MAG: fumarylacetoacetate hydrolase family protein [bacterium]
MIYYLTSLQIVIFLVSWRYFNKIIANISTYFSLNIGDLVYTGTPAGVGECVVGDLLEGYLEKEKMFDLIIK